MERIQVASSNISEIGYDPKTSTLEVAFANGTVYQYFDVPMRVRDELINAPSAGKYFHAEIRGVYRFARV